MSLDGDLTLVVNEVLHALHHTVLVVVVKAEVLSETAVAVVGQGLVVLREGLEPYLVYYRLN